MFFVRGSLLAKRDITQETHLRRVKGSGSLGVPQALSCTDGLSLQPDWSLNRCPSLCSELLKKKIVVQFESVLVYLPSRGACALSESGAEFLGHPLFAGLFLADIHPPDSWF